jgi:6-phosphogluconolactonase
VSEAARSTVEGIERFDAAEAWIDACAALLVEALEAGLDSRGEAVLAVSGGRTPGPVFDRLARTPLDWSQVAVTLVDDRWVDEDHPDSNAGLVKRRLLVGEAARATFVPLKRGRATPEEDAAEAARSLDLLFNTPHPRESGDPGVFAPAPTTSQADGRAETNDKSLGPRFRGDQRVFGARSAPDAVLLGMGDDGHFASLFPGNPALAAGLRGDAIVLAAPAGTGLPPPQPRLTLSLPPIANARRVVLALSGPSKLDTLARARDGADPTELPIRAVLAQARDLRILWTPETIR